MPTLEDGVETLEVRRAPTFFPVSLTQALVKNVLKAALIGGFIGACLGAGGSAAFLPKQYRGVSYLYLSSQRTEVAFDPRFRNIASDIPDLTARRRSLEALLESTEVISLVLAKVKDRLPAEDTDPKRFKDLLDTTSAGEVITITAYASEPSLAADIANAWARVSRDRLNLLVAGGGGDPEAMEASRRRVQQAYTRAQQAYNEFISREDRTDMVASLIDGKEKEHAELRESLARVRQGVADLTGLRNELKPAAPGKERPARYADELAALLVRVNTMDTSLRLQAPLQVQLTQSHPEGSPAAASDAVRSIDVALEQLQRRQVELEKSLANSTLQQDCLTLQGQVEQFQSRKRELLTERDQALETYATVTKKLEENRVMTELGTGAVSIAASAMPDSRAARPRIVFNAAIGFAVLAALFGGAAFLRSSFWASQVRSSTSPS
jgi:capsular polysaccharide biosynthesis protein